MEPKLFIWIVALIVLLPFVAAASSVLIVESSREPRHRCRCRSLVAIVLLLVGIGCALAVVHASV